MILFNCVKFECNANNLTYLRLEFHIAFYIPGVQTIMIRQHIHVIIRIRYYHVMISVFSNEMSHWRHTLWKIIDVNRKSDFLLLIPGSTWAIFLAWLFVWEKTFCVGLLKKLEVDSSVFHFIFLYINLRSVRVSVCQSDAVVWRSQQTLLGNWGTKLMLITRGRSTLYSYGHKITYDIM